MDGWKRRNEKKKKRPKQMKKGNKTCILFITLRRQEPREKPFLGIRRRRLARMVKGALDDRVVARQKVELENVALVSGDNLRAKDEPVCFDDNGVGCCYPRKESASEHGDNPCRDVIVKR